MLDLVHFTVWMFDVPLQLHQNFVADRVNGLNLVVPMLPQMRAANQLNTK